MNSVMISERMPFKTTTPLLEHQQAAVAKLLPARVGALFMSMGTGKSRTAMEFVRLRLAKIDRVIWFCPVSLKETIRYEILKHTNCADADICVFDDRTSRRTIPESALWYIVGIESMSSSTRAVFAAHQLINERTFVIVDESTYIKGHRSLRTERITSMSQPARYRMVLNGTPITQGVVDLFAQMRFLDPRILGYRSFYSFSANHLEYHPHHPGLVVRSHNVDVLAAKIQPYVYQVTKEECLTLPDKLYETYACSLTPEQQEAYDRAKNLLLDAVEPDDWDALFIFRLFTALQGVVCGQWKRPDGIVETLRHNRIGLLMDVLERIQNPEKVVIWARYHHSVRDIAAALSTQYGPDTVAEFHGGLSERIRNLNLARWRRSARFLLATEGVGGHGLTLNEARYAVFYANGFKYSERIQAEDRMHRIGQEHRPLYIDLTSRSRIEERIFQTLARKGNALHEFRRQVDQVKKQGTKDKLLALVSGL